ncbi:MAG TPA: BlaI/MecI/CopY family transcriptional regulator [Rhodothermales bacterium]|nr:BlaI/MecI/CopY family transcriptional regulator [Rhodothermales bacterium]
MSASASPRPTDAELTILRVLWRQGPSTVRSVHEAIGHGTGYTNVLKLLQNMTDKGLAQRDESGRAHVYTAAVEEEHTQRRLLDEFVDRAFGGSARQLVLRALGTRGASKQDLAEIEALLDRIEPEDRVEGDDKGAHQTGRGDGRA